MKGSSIEQMLQQELDGVQAQIEAKREELRPIEEQARKLERMIREYTSGSMGSSDVTDDQIVTWLRRNAHEDDRRTTREIAAAFGGDGRGFSKRLPRLVRDNMIFGDPKTGYYVAIKTRSRERATAA